MYVCCIFVVCLFVCVVLMMSVCSHLQVISGRSSKPDYPPAAAGVLCVGETTGDPLRGEAGLGIDRYTPEDGGEHHQCCHTSNS